jgi:hypothetical protein
MASSALGIETTSVGLTVRDVAKRYRVSPDKVRAWIKRGELVAVNTSAVLCARPRWVVMPGALTDFERKRNGGTPAPPPRRRLRPPTIDYYPDQLHGGDYREC